MRAFQDLFRKFAHINWAIADQAVVSGTNFATTVLVARFLGVEEFGRFALAWLAVFFAQNLQIALIIQPMMTIGAKQTPQERPAYCGAVLLQQLMLALATFLLVFAVLRSSDGLFPEWGLGGLALPVSALVLVAQGTEFFRRYYFTFSRPALSFAIDCIRYGNQFALLLGLFMTGGQFATISYVFYAMAASGLAAFFVGAACLRNIAFDRSKFSGVARRQWRFARWLAPSVFSLWARENLLYTVVGASFGLAEVGLLRASQQLVTMINVPLHGFANIVPMRAGAAFSSRGYSGLVDFVDGFVLRYKAGILALLIAIAAAGEPLLRFIYGAEYAGNGAIVVAFALAMMVHLLRNTIAIMVQAMEATVYEFYASIASIAVMAITIFPLAQAFGIAGVMLSFLLYECAALLAISLGLRGRMVLQ